MMTKKKKIKKNTTWQREHGELGNSFRKDGIFSFISSVMNEPFTLIGGKVTSYT